MNKNEKIVLMLIMGTILLLVVCLNRFRYNELLENYQLTTGEVIKVSTNIKSGGGILFTFEGRTSKYIPIITCSSKCKKKVQSMLSEIKKHKFPVAYDPKNHENANILLFRSQYKKFNTEIPDDVEIIVAELSKCEE